MIAVPDTLSSSAPELGGLRLLVVGADGIIGSALCAVAARLGAEATGTSRRAERMLDTAHWPLDLSTEPDGWALPGQFDAAVICAAQASIAGCAADPESTRRVNVTHTAALAHRLAGDGAHVILLSTSMVFDGTRAFRRAEEPVCPITEYGRQKAAAEEAVLALGRAATVLRLTKVLPERPPLFAGWLADLRAGRRISPFADLPIAPVALPVVAAVLCRLVAAPQPGIFQVSASRDISYADAARHLAACHGLEPALIEPVSSLAAGIPAEAKPAHTTLDMAGLTKAFGFIPTSPFDGLPAADAPAA